MKSWTRVSALSSWINIDASALNPPSVGCSIMLISSAGAINRHKTIEYRPRPSPTFHPGARPRNNVYVNPSYKPPSKLASTPTIPPGQPPKSAAANEKREVVIGGVAFESSGRSLVRKDCASSFPTRLDQQVSRDCNEPILFTVAASKPKPPPSKPPVPNGSFAGTKATALHHASKYKPKPRRGRPTNRNMTLNNTRRPYQAGCVILSCLLDQTTETSHHKCPPPQICGQALSAVHDDRCVQSILICVRSQLSISGACTRGLTCLYQHDAAKIAICWPFLQGNCPHTASTCNLSHDPTPQRTPLCVHFANQGRCTRPNCPFPHVRVGAREGVCRDFAVLGYCEKGLDCEHQHVRECPDFAEKGVCTTKGCKLPHVIRANRNRPRPAAGTSSSDSKASSDPAASSSGADLGSGDAASSQGLTAEDAQLGDEYISLTFLESDPEVDDEEDDEEEESGGEEQAVDEEGEEQSSQHSSAHEE